MELALHLFVQLLLQLHECFQCAVTVVDEMVALTVRVNCNPWFGEDRLVEAALSEDVLESLHASPACGSPPAALVKTNVLKWHAHGLEELWR